MTRLTLPYLSANVTDATLTRWLRNSGDHIRRGEALAELTTEKATFDFESPADGFLVQTLAPEGSILPVGYIIAILGEKGESDLTAEEENRKCLADARQTLEAAPIPLGDIASPSPDTTTRIRATPKARRLAREHGIDLNAVQTASGANVITEALLAPYLPSPPAT